MKTILMTATTRPIGGDLFGKATEDKKCGCQVKQTCGCGCHQKEKVMITGGERPTRVTGKVIDATTKQVMPLTEVFVRQNSTGTIADDNGNFDLTTTKGDDIIEFNFMGYESKQIPASKVPQIVELRQIENTLDEVIVTAKKSVKDNTALWVAGGLLLLFGYAKTKGTKKRTAKKTATNG